MSNEEPDLNEILDAIKSTSQQAGLNVYPNVMLVANSPALVVIPKGADFTSAFNKGGDTYLFDAYLLVANTDSVSAQRTLNQYISGKGPKSVREMFFDADDMGLEGVAGVIVTKMWGYDGKFKIANVDYVGAALRLSVITN